MAWRQSANELMDIDKHYQRKEHALFSRMEIHGITGPSKPPPNRFFASTAPTEPCRLLAPTRVIEPGLNSLSRLRIVMASSRLAGSIRSDVELRYRH